VKKQQIKGEKGSAKILDANGSRLLVVSSPEELKVISSPQRQRIFKLLYTSDKPLHGKEIADRLGIKAPSAHFHLQKLVKIGAVRISHTQNIKGITATYYEPAVDIMMTGEDFLLSTDDENIREQLAFTSNIFNEAKTSFISSLEKKINENSDSSGNEVYAILLSELLYLSSTEIKNFQKELENLTTKYSSPSPDRQLYTMLVSVSNFVI